eukprot:TRINITY_DN2422_c0_g1_i1.p1 TRINITY_DN2422_c0_g1~~TRINITY_DN2422_c0_g1_i1.p1  ORF type:complete len:215 (+),score=23.94 TRINITY_DN2422_c0_g1_i1:684-1328(+)
MMAKISSQSNDLVTNYLSMRKELVQLVHQSFPMEEGEVLVRIHWLAVILAFNLTRSRMTALNILSASHAIPNSIVIANITGIDVWHAVLECKKGRLDIGAYSSDFVPSLKKTFNLCAQAVNQLPLHESAVFVDGGAVALQALSVACGAAMWSRNAVKESGVFTYDYISVLLAHPKQCSAALSFLIHFPNHWLYAKDAAALYSQQLLTTFPPYLC